MHFGPYSLSIYLSEATTSTGKQVWIRTPDSSNVKQFTYDGHGKILTVQFLDDSIYNYYEVPDTVYQQMNKAQSKGKFLHRQVKDHYKYHRL